MRGVFFEPDERTRTPYGPINFIYKPSKKHDGSFSVFLSIESNAVNFYKLEEENGNHSIKKPIKLFSLNAEKDKKELSDSLINDVFDYDKNNNEFERKRIFYGYTEAFFSSGNGNKGKSVNKNSKNDAKGHSKVKVKNYELFLDFLFDMEMTDVFTETTYFKGIKKSLKENVLFKAIALKAAFLYRYKQFKDLGNDIKKTKVVSENLKHACKKWVDFLVGEEAKALPRKSKWIKRLEDEVVDAHRNIITIKKTIPKSNSLNTFEQEINELKYKLEKWLRAKHFVVEFYTIKLKIKLKSIVEYIKFMFQAFKQPGVLFEKLLRSFITIGEIINPFPVVTIAIGLAWITLSMTTEFWVVFATLSLTEILRWSLFAFIFSFICLLLIVRKWHSDKTFKGVFWNALVFFAASFFWSFIIGMLAANLWMKPIMNNSQATEKETNLTKIERVYDIHCINKSKNNVPLFDLLDSCNYKNSKFKFNYHLLKTHDKKYLFDCPCIVLLASSLFCMFFGIVFIVFFERKPLVYIEDE